MNFPLMRKLVPYARSLGARLGVQVGFGIVTNGTLLTDEMKQFLLMKSFRLRSAWMVGATHRIAFASFTMVLVLMMLWQRM